MNRFHLSTSAITRRTALGSLATAAALSAPLAWSQDRFKEPIHRVAKAKVEAKPNGQQHPLDPAIQLAKDALVDFRRRVKDYQAVVVKRERINNVLGDYQYMFVKIRNERRENGRIVQPFSVYAYFLKPEEIKGREVLYIKGANNGKMLAHEGKNSILYRFGSVWLKPDGPVAMKGQRYPIYEIGIENLIVKLIEKGVRDRQRGECQVEFRKGAVVNGRRCTMLQVTHPVPRPYFDFHIAQIYIDDQRNVPIRYAAYTWPRKPGGKPQVIEEYTYLKLELNKGFTDKDFDPKNPNYNF